MASATATATATAAAGHGTNDHSTRKRRRREPDWNAFYKNGLPKEIIVIDDSPEPEARVSRKLTSSNTHGHASAGAASYETNGTTRHPVKQRRLDDAAPGYHIQYVGSQTNTLQNATLNGSTLSSDRTNSVHDTTAPTSVSSNGQNEDAPAPPLKRKRTTRHQVANEAKRRVTDGLGGPCLTYKPPPLPPKKVADVQVRVVHDVSISILLSFSSPLPGCTSCWGFVYQHLTSVAEYYCLRGIWC